DLLLLHRPVKTETIFQDWVRSFKLSFALLPFSVTESLELLEVSLFRRFHLSFSAGWKRIFKKRSKKKAKNKQIQVRSGKGKVKSQAK
ncbi:hypothetical protein Tco_0302112, partial [Tanacetum coccineum]